MSLRVLNDYLLVEPDPNHYVSDNPEVVRIAKEGLIQIPNNNSIEHRANSGTVVSCGSKCYYRFKPGQKVYFKQWDIESFYHMINGKKLRFFAEHEINAVDEDAGS